MDGMDQEILIEFFTEAEESLDTLEQDLIRLESLAADGDTDAELVDRIFRVLHTLKGGAGFLGLDKMSKLAHAGETLLDEVRGGRVKVTTPVMDALLESNDTLRELLEDYKAGNNGSDIDPNTLTTTLENLICGDGDSAPPPTPPETTEEPTTEIETTAEQPATAEAPPTNDDLMAEVINDPSLAPKEPDETKAPSAAATPAKKPTVNAALLDEVMNDPDLAPDKDKEAATEEKTKPASASTTEKPPVNVELLEEVMNDPDLDPNQAKAEKDTPVADSGTVTQEVAPPQPRGVAPLERRGDDRRENPPERRQQSRRKLDAPAETLRIETTRLDEVMNLVGELVLARNSLLRQLTTPEAQKALSTLPNHSVIQNNFEVFGRVTTDLQTAVLRTRMQPVAKVFDKIPRQVRTLKNQLNKEVALVIEGEDTEVDKSLVDDLADPMVHLIRNALDHGIEDPDTREQAGKPREGTLKIRAFYEGNNVVIEVSDDGKGIPADVIASKAVKKGIITQSAMEQMSDAEKVRLILAAGFSTAESVSDVSGRGVGMDVVNANIQKLKGQLDIRSEFGTGTTIRLQLPLTLAIVQALVVEASNELFAIPIGDVAEVIKFKPSILRQVNNKDVMELRGETLPLFYLNQLTKKPTGRSEHGFIVIIREAHSMIGLVVDKLHGQEEAVIKQLGSLFSAHPAVAGATINGDGQVQMILDVPFLLKDLSRAA
jgi:two-component system chemotaxis sensor kinase CheA